VITEADLELGDGRTLHYYDTREDDPEGRAVVFWHHGTPNVGSPPEPLFPAAAGNSLRWVSYDRPAYGGSTPNPGRDVASAADVAAIADALGIGRFSVLGHSGGGPHALACGRSCAHGEWLAAHCPAAELRLAPGAGHITVLDSAPAALEWLRDRVALDSPG
jgi:pimeloyl-ACP methyl ester carboxylesterase